MSDTSPGSLRVALQIHIFLVPSYYSVYKYAHDNAQALGALTHVTLEDNNNFLGFPSYICSMPQWNKRPTSERKRTFLSGACIATNKNLT